MNLSLQPNFCARELAKFFDGNSLNRRKDLLWQHENDRDYDDVHARDYDHAHLSQQLVEIYTSHNSSALALAEFQFLALVVQRIIEDAVPFLASKIQKYLDVAPAVRRRCQRSF